MIRGWCGCDIKIGRGTHLMHLEVMRHALYRESIAFLEGSPAPMRSVDVSGLAS
jgi:hypothetical protein